MGINYFSTLKKEIMESSFLSGPEGKSSLRLNLFIFLLLFCGEVVFACFEHYKGKEMAFSNSELYFVGICVTTIFLPKLADKALTIGQSILAMKAGITKTVETKSETKTEEQK